MFDDDNFWVKLDRGDDEIEFMNNSPTYNGSKYRKTNTQTNTSKTATNTNKSKTATAENTKKEDAQTEGGNA